MFGKRSSGPQAKTKSVEQADAIDAPLEKVELSKEKLTEIQATAAEGSKPTQPPLASTGSKIQKQSAQTEPAAEHVELFGEDKNRHNETKQAIFSSLVEAVDLTEFGKLDATQVREEITEIIGEIIALKAMVLSSAEQQELITDICNDVLGLGPLEPLLERDDISDIMVNGAEKVYIEVNGQIQ